MKVDYQEIMKQHFKTSARNPDCNGVFQLDSDFKLTSKAVKKNKKITWAKSGHHKTLTIKNLLTELKMYAKQESPKNLTELNQFPQDE